MFNLKDKKRLYRFIKISKNGCWEWQGFVWEKGYGGFGKNGKNIRAHRASWIIHNGKIPKGILVLHKCDNPPCINPKHLYLGTAKDNTRDAIERGRFVYNLPSQINLRSI